MRLVEMSCSAVKLCKVDTGLGKGGILRGEFGCKRREGIGRASDGPGGLMTQARLITEQRRLSELLDIR